MNDLKFFQEKFYGKNTELVSNNYQSWEACMIDYYYHEVERNGRTFINDEYVLEMVTKVAEWIRGEYTSCMMTGGVGVGKTALLKSLMKLFDDYRVPISIPPLKCRPLVFFDATELCGKYVHNDDVKYEVHNCKVLFLDDVGDEAYQYTWFGNVVHPIHDILISRYASRLPTVIATNLELDDFAKRYGARVTDRVNELYYIIECPSHESYRRLPLKFHKMNINDNDKNLSKR